MSSSSGQSNYRRRSGLAVWCTRFGALFNRTSVYKLREPSAMATQAVNSVLIPLLIGSIYFNLPLTVSSSSDRLSAISLIVLLQSFMAFDQLLLFPKERGLYLHESNGGMYTTSVFYWAKTIVESITIVMFALMCACISYEMFGLDDSADGRISYYIIVVAVTMAGAAFLTMIGSVCKTFEQTNALAIVLLVVLMMFDGNWINRRNIPAYYRWLPEVSFLGYAVEAAVASDFKRHDFSCTARAIREEGCVPLTGNQVLRSLDFDPDSTWPNFWLLVTVTCLYRLVTFFGLHFCWTGQTFKERWAKLFESV
jgi:ATP-binding cassette subfamily G (WHITE) protein 2